MTDFVCHTTSIENAVNDPADYFEYNMLAWGNCIPSELKDKVIYAENDCKDIWDWSEKVYKIVESTENKNK